MLLTTLSRFFLTHTHLNLYIFIPVFMWYVNGFIHVHEFILWDVILYSCIEGFASIMICSLKFITQINILYMYFYISSYTFLWFEKE